MLAAYLASVSKPPGSMSLGVPGIGRPDSVVWVPSSQLPSACCTWILPACMVELDSQTEFQ